ncbi:MAG: RNA methyltransferase [Anaerolineaceae bacterium]|nr:RNA methyltransferase [Anaerolineaceae bacterium]
MRITSTANPQIKQIRKLKDRKERKRTNLFFLEGIRIVAEAAAQQAEIELLVYSPELLTSDFGLSVVREVEKRGIPILEVSEEVFRSVAQKENPQGLAAVAKQRWHRLDDVDFDQDPIWVALDTIRDPGNLGTILRTLDGMGGAGVILLGASCDPYDPTAIRASMGAFFTKKIIQTDFDQFAEWKSRNHITLVGTSDHAGTIHYRNYHYPRDLVLFMGSERAGLPENYQALCNQMVFIPMVGDCDSLNLAVATGVVLYEIYEQRYGEAV